jgi:heme exporter protein B
VSLVAGLAAVVRRDLLVALRQRGDALNVLAFFAIVATLVPLGIGAEPAVLRAIGAGVIWVAALLASLLALPRLFAADLADGVLEQLVIGRDPLPLVVLAKVTAHWLLTGLPISLLAPLLGVQFDLPGPAIAVLACGLALGTPALSLLGAIGAALTLGARGAGALLGLLVLPLYVPVLIFGAAAVRAELDGLAVLPHLALLSASSLIALVLSLPATAAALRLAVE